MEETERVAELLQGIQRDLRVLMDQFLTEQGLPFVRVTVLRQLGNEPGLTVSDLSRRLGLSKGYLSVVLEQMMVDGLILKKSNPDDQRLICLELTEAAQTLRVRLLDSYRRFMTELLADIPPADLTAMVAGLERLRATLAPRARSDR